MAEGGGDLEEGGEFESDSLEEVITCKVCYLYMEDARILLPCTHNFCAQCVSKLDRKIEKGQVTISCPMCREDITEENIHRNRTMTELIDIVKAKKQKSGGDVSASMCSQCDSSAIVYKCTHCDSTLCKSCEPRHSRLPKCKNKIFFLEEAEEMKRKSTVIYCSKHPDKAIEMNCKTCNQAICAECKFTDHDRHESESLESALQRYREMVNNALDEMKKNTSSSKAQIEVIQKKMEMVGNNQIEEETKINKTREKFMFHIDKEAEQLLLDLEIQCGAQLKDLQLELESVESSLSCDNSIQTWTEAILTNTDGGVLLTELQSGLFNKIQQQQAATSQQTDSSCKLYTFKPSQLQPSLLGQISQSYQEVRGVCSTGQDDEVHVTGEDSTTNVTSYRCVNIELKTLNSRQLTKKCDIQIKESSDRLCLFQDKFYVIDDNTIEVFSLSGETIQTTQLQGIESPRSLHPVNSTQLLLASASGLHVLDSNTLTITSQMATGNFYDACVDGNTIASLRYDEKKVYLWDVKHMSQPKHSFTVKPGIFLITLCICNNYIYVCDCFGNTIHKYNMKGDHIQQYGVYGRCGPGELHNPKVCVTDKQGSMLVADCSNHRLQVLSAFGQWSVLNTQVNKPRDAVIAEDTLYVLHGYGHTLTAFNIM